MTTHESALLSTREAGRLLGLHPRTVERMARRGDLLAVRLGPRGRWRIPRSNVERIIRSEPTTTPHGERREVQGP